MKFIVFIFSVLLLSIIFICPGMAQESSKSRSGDAIYAENCIGCHPGGGNVIKPRDVLKGSPHLKSEQKFAAWIRKPVQPMPPFPLAKISESEAKVLYVYILEQLKGAWK
jgi:cytochrome c6